MFQGEKSGMDTPAEREARPPETPYKFRGVWREESRYRAWGAVQKLTDTEARIIPFVPEQ